MRNDLLMFVCGCWMVAAFFSCSNGSIPGLSVQPDEDEVWVTYDTVHVRTETIFMDSVFLRNSLACLGEFTDAEYGTVKEDFMAQLYCPWDFGFPDDVLAIDSAFMYFYVGGYFGDSTALHHISVYELNKPLDEETVYYTNTDASAFCDRTRLIAEGAFETGDMNASDSVKALKSYQRVVKIPVSLSFANRIFNDVQLHPEYFNGPDNFKKYFNGIYVTTDYGNGSLLYITKTKLELCYDTWLQSESTGYRDSMVVAGAYLPITKEVKQVNKVKYPDLSSYIQTSLQDSLNYIYAPAAMYTKVTIPEDLFTKDGGMLSGKTVSRFRLKIKVTQTDHSDDREYVLDPPQALLLLNVADAQSFFQGYELNDGVHSFLAEYDSDDREYVFDLSRYAQKMIHKMDGTGSVDDFVPFTEMIVVPVSVIQNTAGDEIRIDHVVTPSAVKIKGCNHPDEPMRLEILYNTSK